MVKLAVIGSTGSVGTQGLAVAAKRSDEIEVKILASGRGGAALLAQAERFRPAFCCIADESAKVNEGLYPFTKFVYGAGALTELMRDADYDTVLLASSGTSTLRAAAAAVERGVRVAVANKELLVCAGAAIMESAKRSGARLLPVDSEHFAVSRCLEGGREGLSGIILTASGGPFLGYAKERLSSVTAEQAVRHPKWSMGKKISVDSATMMNKGLEVIEASHLFGLPIEKIRAVLHPESVIHGMAEFEDGSVIAHLAPASMEIPLQYALLGGENASAPAGFLDFETLGSLSFQKLRREDYPCFGLALSAAEEGGTAPAVMNGANEAAVEAFLAGGIKFTQIPYYIRMALTLVPIYPDTSIAAAEEADALSKAFVKKAILS